MKTTIFRLPITVKGDDFEKLNVYRINFTAGNTVGNIGKVCLRAIQENLSRVKITGGLFYSDSDCTILVGDTYVVPTGANQMFFKLSETTSYIEIYNLEGIGSLGGTTDYLFGDSSLRPRGPVYTKDLYKFPNLTRMWVSIGGLKGLLSEIPPQITDLRLEGSGLEGSLGDLNGDTFTHLRLIQTTVTGRLPELSAKTITTLILGCPLVTGDVVELLSVSGLTRINLGNIASSGLSRYPLTCSLTENVYFPEVTQIGLQNIHLDRASLLNTMRSFSKSEWFKTSGISETLKLSTTITEEEFVSDTALQNALEELKAKGGSDFIFTINYV